MLKGTGGITSGNSVLSFLIPFHLSFTQFKKLADRSFQFSIFMLARLPSAYFCGVRLCRISEEEAVVSVPYKWLSQNPFRSIYFACQAMAAEMSTGLLALGHSHGLQPPVSMLVTRLEASFTKKASEKIYFTCAGGAAIRQAISRAMETGEGQTVSAHSIGRNKAGELVSSFTIEWSFKPKQR